MKQFLIVTILILHLGLLNAQTNWNYSDTFTANCMGGIKSNTSDGDFISIQNDSIIISDLFENQCCPKFALRVSTIQNDSLYVDFQDTTDLLCDCMCEFNVKLNIGSYVSDKLHINYKGIWYSFDNTNIDKITFNSTYLLSKQVSDYIVIKNSETQLKYIITDISGRLISSGFTNDRINVQKLKKGYYIISLFSQDSKLLEQKKILKE